MTYTQEFLIRTVAWFRWTYLWGRFHVQHMHDLSLGFYLCGVTVGVRALRSF